MPSSSRSNTPGAQNEQLPEPMQRSRSILMSSATSTSASSTLLGDDASPRRRRTGRTASSTCGCHVGSGSTTRAVRAQRAASVIDVSSPHASRARNAAPSAPPSGTAHTCTGSPVQSASASTQPSSARAAAGRDDAARRNRASRRSCGASRTRSLRARRAARPRAVREVEVDELAAPVGILERHPLAARVRHPDRDAARDRPRSVAVAERARSPS